MSLKGKICVVLGATGQVGSGASLSFLQEGATVVIVGRDQAKLEEFGKKVTTLANAPSDHVVCVSGFFDKEAHALAAVEKIIKALNGKKIDHVVNSMSCSPMSTAGPLGSDPTALQKCVSDFVLPDMWAARQFMPMLKDREGSSYTQLNGGLAHVCPMPQIWMGTARNSLINGLTLGFASETKDWAVRFNTFCIHFGVGEFGAKKSKHGIDAVDTRKVGPFFPLLANSVVKGSVICSSSADAAMEQARNFPTAAGDAAKALGAK